MKTEIQLNKDNEQTFKKLTKQIESLKNINDNLTTTNERLTEHLGNLRNDYNNSRDEIRKLKREMLNSSDLIELKNETIGILNNRIQNCKEELDNKQIYKNKTNGINPFN